MRDVLPSRVRERMKQQLRTMWGHTMCALARFLWWVSLRFERAMWAASTLGNDCWGVGDRILREKR